MKEIWKDIKGFEKMLMEVMEAVAVKPFINILLMENLLQYGLALWKL